MNENMTLLRPCDKTSKGTNRNRYFLQVSDIQKMMGISRASAYALVKQEGFPRIMVGNRIVIPRDKFREWVVKSAATRRG